MGQIEFKYVLLFKKPSEYKRLSAVSLNILKTFYRFQPIYFNLDRRQETLWHGFSAPSLMECSFPNSRFLHISILKPDFF